MLKRSRRQRNDEGQGLIVAIAAVAIAATLMVALEISVVGDAKLATASTNQEQALQAAETGLANYQTWVNGSASQWRYAMNWCSSGTFSGCANRVGTTPTSANPDPNNAAFSGVPDPACMTSPYSATSAGSSVGTANYFGWVTVHGSGAGGGFAEQYQYVVDSSLAKPLGGYVHVFVTGRAGRSGHYVCSTLKALYNGPQLIGANTVVLAPASCSGQTLAVTAPAVGTGINAVSIEATGGAGQTGGSGGLSSGGGAGGKGETVEATYAASNTTTLYVNIGCQGGSNTSITPGGAGFSSGGALPSNGNAGGGGGATAVCSISPCTSSSITGSNLANQLYLLAGGGGGGGEGLFGATAAGGGGGTGVITSVTSGKAEDGSIGATATAWFSIPGGTGGAGGKASTGYSPAGGAGNQTSAFFSADGGAGGSGYSGGSGGNVGFGGGGGGAGSSFYNTNTAPSGASPIGANIAAAPGTGFYGAGVTMRTAPVNYGQVVIQWGTWTAASLTFDEVGTPVIPAYCGPYSERTTAIPALSNVSLQVNGGSGGDGVALGTLNFASGGTQGVGTMLVGTYQNTSTSTVDVTAIQGCMGSIGASSGTIPGGDGLESSGQSSSGGANCAGCSNGQGDSGSGGGASAICVGTVAPGTDSPTNNNCYPGGVPSASDILMAAGGGGAGGGLGISLLGFCTGGDGGNAGTATASDWPASTSLTTGGVTGGAGQTDSCGGVTAGGGGSASAYGPTGGNGNGVSGGSDPSCSGDGGGAGGGFGGGSGGQAGAGLSLFGFCIIEYAGAGGGGGSSYLSTGNGSMQLQQCAAGGQCLYSPCPTPGSSNPTTNQINTSSVPVYEGEWCSAQQNTNGAVSVTETAIPNSSVVISQSPGALNSTTW